MPGYSNTSSQTDWLKVYLKRGEDRYILGYIVGENDDQNVILGALIVNQLRETFAEYQGTFYWDRMGNREKLIQNPYVFNIAPTFEQLLRFLDRCKPIIDAAPAETPDDDD